MLDFIHNLAYGLNRYGKSLDDLERFVSKYYTNNMRKELSEMVLERGLSSLPARNADQARREILRRTLFEMLAYMAEGLEHENRSTVDLHDVETVLTDPDLGLPFVRFYQPRPLEQIVVQARTRRQTRAYYF